MLQVIRYCRPPTITVDRLEAGQDTALDVGPTPEVVVVRMVLRVATVEPGAVGLVLNVPPTEPGAVGLVFVVPPSEPGAVVVRTMLPAD